MKHLLIALACTMQMVLGAPKVAQPEKNQPEKYLIDKILAVIYTSEGSAIVTQSDLRPGIDGMPRTLEQAILEELMLADAKKLKVSVTDADVDRHLAQVQKQHGLTMDDIAQLFSELGLSQAEGREKFRRMQIIDQTMDYRVRTKILVEKKDIEEYHKAHPEIIPAKFVFSQTTVPFNQDKTKEAQRKEIQAQIKDRSLLTKVPWQPEFEIQEADIAPERAFIKDLDAGTIVKLNETDEGMNLLHIIQKTPEIVVPLKEREKEIQQLIGRERFDKVLKEYQDKLMQSARVRYTE